MKWQRYWKAIAGALTPGAVVIVSSITPQSDAGSTITTSEWITAVAAIVISGGAVFAAPPNDYTNPQRETVTSTDPIPQPPPDGPTAMYPEEPPGEEPPMGR